MVTLLHNMSVPPRSRLQVERFALAGRRYRVDLARALRLKPECSDTALTVLFRTYGLGAARALLSRTAPGVSLATLTGRAASLARRGDDHEGRVRRQCEQAVVDLRLPTAIGYFVERDDVGAGGLVTPVQALALLAARSGPLYLPGRFEPSLVTVTAVTLFFPDD